jgi:hypothetical protein
MDLQNCIDFHQQISHGDVAYFLNLNSVLELSQSLAVYMETYEPTTLCSNFKGTFLNL